MSGDDARPDSYHILAKEAFSARSTSETANSKSAY